MCRHVCSTCHFIARSGDEEPCASCDYTNDRWEINPALLDDDDYSFGYDEEDDDEDENYY